MKSWRTMLSATMAVVVLSGASALAGVRSDVLKKTTKGSPQLQSVNAISFAGEGVLLIADGQGSQIFAVKTDDTESKGAVKKVANIAGAIAERLGVKADGVEIRDLAVNPASKAVYLAVHKKDDKSNLIVRVGASGKVEEVPLENVEYARLVIPQTKETTVSLITDVAWADDRVIAGARANDAFVSKIFVVTGPLEHEAKGQIYSAETYHVAHGKWETRAPMSVVLPYEEGGKKYVVGAFTCTPVVKYPIDSLEPQAKVKGTSVIELGSGNQPIDMFTYQKDGKWFVLTNTNRRHHDRKPFGPSPFWTARIDRDILAENTAVNEKAQWRIDKDYKPITDRVKMIEAYHGVQQMDKLDDSNAVALRDSGNGLDLEVLALP